MWAGDAISGCQMFLQKKRYFPSCVGIAPHLEAGGAPLQAPPDVAVLIAIGYGGFLRTMEALTLQRSEITEHRSRVL